ncbi:MAG: DNA methyltransferase [Burkholderiales bacterium]|nr:DNA methyltransferase [Burkholderiales bacterium]
MKSVREQLHAEQEQAFCSAPTELICSASSAELTAAARDKARVSGLTHNFYRYPARFSPKFVRAAISMFTKPGDLVFDPFMGGGTSLVEAIALGRKAVGTDISSLATFVSEAKTTLFSDNELAELHAWAESLSDTVNIRKPAPTWAEYEAAGYYKHLGSTFTWRLRKSIEQALGSAISLPPKLELFARCVVLRTAQWALDGRKQLPSVDQFRDALIEFAVDMLKGTRELRSAVDNFGQPSPSAICVNRTVEGLEKTNLFAARQPRLVLTSPPYPGVHVLYHRWQVDGRKETAAPFWIANKLDGSGASHYTLGDRHAADNWTYFEGLQRSLSSIAQICSDETTVIQVVAFSEPKRQLLRYLEVAEAAGFEELSLAGLVDGDDGRLWRTIPNRKWHAGQMGNIPSSQEVVLFHRRRRA